MDGWSKEDYHRQQEAVLVVVLEPDYAQSCRVRITAKVLEWRTLVLKLCMHGGLVNSSMNAQR
jgi:hypothetical protein